VAGYVEHRELETLLAQRGAKRRLEPETEECLEVLVGALGEISEEGVDVAAFYY
jgi:hypothetical protein